MSFSIAVAGKGGSGKTSITSLIIRYLKKNGKSPILAVDADPNANLGDSLGMPVNQVQTVGVVLDVFQRDKIEIPQGMTKESYLDFKLNSIIVESKGIDLLTMGRGEGPECYCYPNVILKKFIDRLSENYAFVVVDNEAGMEHLSRGTTQDIDVLLIVSNHSVKGVRTIARIMELITALKLRIKRQLVVINMAPPQMDTLVIDELKRLGITPSAIIPVDTDIYKYDLAMQPLLNLPDSSVAVKAIDGLMSQILFQEVKK